MVRSLLLEGVSPQEYQTMRACLGVHEQSFRPDDVIYDFGDGRGLLGIVTEGSAVVERIDREGGRAILEHLEPGGVFLRGEAVMRRCEHACACHGRMVENLFHLVTEKAMFLSERVEVLSRRSIREKLLRYFQLQAAKERGRSFLLPFSLSALADYISADRSAMMRELKKMREEMLVTITGRQVTLP